MSTDTRMTPNELLAAWHIQQTAFIEFRAQRTRCMMDVLSGLADERGRPVRVLDLGCGPGSLGTAVLDRMPDAQVVAVDRDPILLRLAKETNRHGDQHVFIDADLAGPDWVTAVPDGTYDAAISATALHWLGPDQLVALYQRLGSLLGDGAVFMNADHLFFDQVHQPFLDKFSQADRDRVQREHLNDGAMGWDEWWEVARSQPGWEKEAAQWHERWSEKHMTIPVSVQFHLSALRAAGFVETAQIWQWLDDRIIFGRRPVESA
ncbi:class I SAM-dependent methyltransferase [Devriesea agamarum]|uniref:class I SAM-dependent methyltransferase n=1 Tax=Devriesea agamarum TaxID=472569 RepID=UPI000A4F5B95|nr:class I SAM-dependent methyltransferase [Devriesea agamarum]